MSSQSKKRTGPTPAAAVERTDTRAATSDADPKPLAMKAPGNVTAGCQPTPINSEPKAIPAPPNQNTRRRPHMWVAHPGVLLMATSGVARF